MSLKYHRCGNFARSIQSYAAISCEPVVLERAEKFLVGQLIFMGQTTPKKKIRSIRSSGGIFACFEESMFTISITSGIHENKYCT